MDFPKVTSYLYPHVYLDKGIHLFWRSCHAGRRLDSTLHVRFKAMKKRV